MTFVVSSFYALTPLKAAQIDLLLADLQGWPVGDPPLNGMVLIAPDGLNATLAGSATTVSQLEAWLAERLPLSTIKHSHSPIPPYRRWKVVRRRETVTSGAVGASPPRAEAAHPTHLTPQQWQQVLENEPVVLVDVRNQYEVRLGTFRGALDPATDNFSQFADFVAGLNVPKDQKILTFCTGGIRCEKAVPYLQRQGYEQIYQLQGGILNYIQHYPNSFFEGECFVFDDRVSLDQELQPTTRYRRCPDCGQPGEDPCPYCP